MNKTSELAATPQTRVLSRNTSYSIRETSAPAQMAAKCARSLINLAGGTSALALVASSNWTAVSAAAWLAQTGREGIILERNRLGPGTSTLLRDRGFRVVSLDEEAVLEAGGRAGLRNTVGVLTSGSTGEPKIITHSWESLYTGAGLKHKDPARWLLTYAPGTYAWYQIVTLFLFGSNTDLILANEPSVASLVEAAMKLGATAVSSTPTFWRLALLQTTHEELAQLRLRQITLGGEPVDDAILATLGRTFPGARMTHIFASTETGPAIVVSDGRAGFPADWLTVQSDERGIREEGGLLLVRSRWAASDQEEWIKTGDRVEIRGDRVHILGRIGHPAINVGGSKASLLVAHARLSNHPWVVWCRVKPIAAPIVGQLLAADVVLGSTAPAGADWEGELAAFCAAELPSHMVPRLFRRLQAVPVGINMKEALVYE